MRVAVVSGSRADYGLLRPTIAALDRDPNFEPLLLVTAMHLQREYGLTVNEIEADGVAIAARVPIGPEPLRSGDWARKIAETTLALTDALAECRPDVLLVLGDRFEALAAALAATALQLPIAHIHGGELSEGSLDDATRHCITKLAHLHFVATREYGERVCQLGEEPHRVHVVGATGLESIRNLEPLERDELARALEVESLESPLVALTFHAASLEAERAGRQTQALVEALDDVLGDGGTIVLTLPNDDPGSEKVRDELMRWSATRPQVHEFAALGQARYLNLLRHADLVVGNSSSALIEAPSFGVPVVDVGDRQRGRIAPDNVVRCAASRADIAAALRCALDPGFRASAADVANPYGDGQVSERIVAVLAAAPPTEELRSKHFFDLPDHRWRSGLRFGTEAT